MNVDLKKILKAISLELRHTLEGKYDEQGNFHPGDLEHRLNALGVWRDRSAKPPDKLLHLPDEDKKARHVIDAYIAFRAEAGVGLGDAVAEFVRESAYTWANRLLCLRCIEARGIIDEVILQKEVYGWRSMVHNRLGRQDPALLATSDDGLFAVLSREFELRARELPGLFNPKAPAIVLRPSLAALKKCIGLLSGTVKAGSNSAATDTVFAAPDALGWAYQYWNAEEKDRVFEKVRTERGAKIEGADIIPATQLYTEPYMVKFLVQNSLGALWMGMYPDSELAENSEYYVRDADRAPVEKKRVQELTFLDPACGSGHFHLEAFDLLYVMYEEEGELDEPESICAAILNHNLYGVDIDERAVQIAQAALWMKAKEVAWDLEPEALTSFHHHFVATNIRLPRGKDHLETFLRKHPEDLPLRPALETVFEGLENAHELGSLLLLEEPVEKELRFLKGKQEEAQRGGLLSALFVEMDKPRQGKLPVGVESYAAWKEKVLSQLRGDFEAESEAADLTQAFFGQSAGKGLSLFDMLARRYDVVTANPPWMGTNNLGSNVARYLAKHFEKGKHDIYAAFILRCLELSSGTKYTAMVTQQSWLFLNSFAGFRFSQDATRKQQGLLNRTRIESLVHLGRYAFSELGNAVIQPVLFILRNLEPQEGHRIFTVKLNTPRESYEQARLLKENVMDGSSRNLSAFVGQSSFTKIPNAPVVYWATPKILSLLAATDRLESRFDVRQGLITGNNERFIRYVWECPNLVNWDPTCRWVLYPKGGGYAKWDGLQYHAISWGQNGELIKAYDVDTGSARIQNQDAYFKSGLTYSLMASGAMACRIHYANSIFDQASICIFGPEDEIPSLQAYLNTRLASFLLRVTTQDIKFSAGYCSRLPYPSSVRSVNNNLTHLAIEAKQGLLAPDLCELMFNPDVGPESCTQKSGLNVNLKNT